MNRGYKFPMDRQDKLEDALNKICYLLEYGYLSECDPIDDYNCKGMHCETCLFRCIDTFHEFLKQYRRGNDFKNAIKSLKKENEGLKERIKAVIECKDEFDKYNTELTADNNSIITENEKLKEKLKDVTECKNELLEENQRLLRMLEENGLLEIADDLERV